MNSLIHLTSSQNSVIIDTPEGRMPSIVYWGKKLGENTCLETLKKVLTPALFPGCMAEYEAPGFLPTFSMAIFSHSALSGHRNGQDWAPEFQLTRVKREQNCVLLTCCSKLPGLELTIKLELCPESSVLSLGYKLTNSGETDYQLDQLFMCLPLFPWCREVMSFTGRWCREFQPQRQKIAMGSLVYENLKGRTSHDHFPALIAGEEGFGEQNSQTAAFHLGWSGNHCLRVEKNQQGQQYLLAGELLMPGEIKLAPGESYHTPALYAVYSPEGLSGVSRNFHTFVREHLLSFPSGKERPVHLNTWEAVYFDHKLEDLKSLASHGAAVGAERFILDDGWFKGRNNDTSSLGDWTVDPGKYPGGLTPLISHVKSLGMEFGLWVEPEMVNPDSDLYRRHPDWILHIPGQTLIPGRYQYVLDLSRPGVFDYIFKSLDNLLTEYNIDYLKWDMNRELIQAGNALGKAGINAQTRSVYKLMDKLEKKYPHLEIESCSSGGARIDYGILKRCHRFWTSDCNDALERQTIQKYASLFIPPEIMGSHIGPAKSHTTRRTHSLAFRAQTALFGHMGIEADLRSLSQAETAELKRYLEFYKKHRSWMHRGTVVRGEHPDISTQITGIVNKDKSCAVFCIAQLKMPEQSVMDPVVFPGLSPLTGYSITFPFIQKGENNPGQEKPAWIKSVLEENSPDFILTGEQLMTHGIRLPTLDPESALIVKFDAAEES